MSKHRSVRGSLTSRIKDATFSVFNLTPVNSNLTESEIKKWKSLPEVKKCHERLFKKVKPSEPETYMSKIISKLWKDKKDVPKVQITFAMSVSETILNPNNFVIQVNEDKIKSLYIKNYVSFLDKLL